MIATGISLQKSGKTDEAIALAQAHLQDRFQYSTIADIFSPDPNKRDTEMSYGDCDVLVAQLKAYLASMGILSDLQYCYMDTNHDETLMKGEYHAILRVNYPDGSIDYIDATQDLKHKASFQNPHANDVPMNRNNPLAPKSLDREAMTDTEKNEIFEQMKTALDSLFQGMEKLQTDPEIISYLGARLDAIEAMEPIDPLQASFYTFVYQHYYLYSTTRDFSPKVYQVLKAQPLVFSKEQSRAFFPDKFIANYYQKVTTHENSHEIAISKQSFVLDTYYKVGKNPGFLEIWQKEGFVADRGQLSQANVTKKTTRMLDGHHISFDEIEKDGSKSQVLQIDDITFDRAKLEKMFGWKSFSATSDPFGMEKGKEVSFERLLRKNIVNGSQDGLLILGFKISPTGSNNRASLEIKTFNCKTKEFQDFPFESTTRSEFLRNKLDKDKLVYRDVSGGVVTAEFVDLTTASFRTYTVDLTNQTTTLSQKKDIIDFPKNDSPNVNIRNFSTPELVKYGDHYRLIKNEVDINGKQISREIYPYIPGGKLGPKIRIPGCTLIKDIATYNGETYILCYMKGNGSDAVPKLVFTKKENPGMLVEYEVYDHSNLVPINNILFSKTGLVNQSGGYYYSLAFEKLLDCKRTRSRHIDQKTGAEKSLGDVINHNIIYVLWESSTDTELKEAGIKKDIGELYPGKDIISGNSAYIDTYVNHKDEDTGWIVHNTVSGETLPIEPHTKSEYFGGTAFDIPPNPLDDPRHDRRRPDASPDIKQENIVTMLERYCRKSPKEELRQQYFSESLAIRKQMRDIEIHYAKEAREMQEDELYSMLYDKLLEQKMSTDLPTITNISGTMEKTGDNKAQRHRTSTEGESKNIDPNSLAYKQALLQFYYPNINFKTKDLREVIDPQEIKDKLKKVPKELKDSLYNEAFLFHEADLVQRYTGFLDKSLMSTSQTLSAKEEKEITKSINQQLSENTDVKTDKIKVGSQEYNDLKTNISEVTRQPYLNKLKKNSYLQRQALQVQQRVRKDPIYQQLARTQQAITQKYLGDGQDSSISDAKVDIAGRQHRKAFEQYETLPNTKKIDLFHSLMLYQEDYLNKWLYPAAEQLGYIKEKATPLDPAQEQRLQTIDEVLRPRKRVIDLKGKIPPHDVYLYPFPHLDPKWNQESNKNERDKLLSERHTICVKPLQQPPPPRKQYDFSKPQELHQYHLEEKREKLRNLTDDQKIAVMTQSLQENFFKQYEDHNFLNVREMMNYIETTDLIYKKQHEQQLIPDYIPSPSASGKDY